MTTAAQRPKQQAHQNLCPRTQQLEQLRRLSLRPDQQRKQHQLKLQACLQQVLQLQAQQVHQHQVHAVIGILL